MQTTTITDIAVVVRETASAPPSDDFYKMLTEDRPPPANLQAFSRFLKDVEFSVENLNFWMAVQRLKLNLASPFCSEMDIVDQVQSILADYIVEGSPHEINIPGTIRSEIIRLTKARPLTSNPFFIAEQSVYNLMKSDPYPRFQKHVAAQETASHYALKRQRDSNLRRRSSAPSLLSLEDLQSSRSSRTMAKADITLNNTHNSTSVRADGASEWTDLLDGKTKPPFSLDEFRTYLRTVEFSDENLDFLLDMRRAQETIKQTPGERKCLENIVTKYISADCPRELNLPGKVRKQVLIHMAEGKTAGVLLESLQVAVRHIEDLVRVDSYPRFVKSITRRSLLVDALLSDADVRPKSLEGAGRSSREPISSLFHIKKSLVH